MRTAALAACLLFLPSCGLYRSVLENSENIKGAVASIAEMVEDGRGVYDGVKASAAEMKASFDAADTDGDGEMSIAEILAWVTSLGGGAWFTQEKLRNRASDARKSKTEAAVQAQTEEMNTLKMKLAVMEAKEQARILEARAS